MDHDFRVVTLFDFFFGVKPLRAIKMFCREPRSDNQIICDDFHFSRMNSLSLSSKMIKLCSLLPVWLVLLGGIVRNHMTCKVVDVEVFGFSFHQNQMSVLSFSAQRLNRDYAATSLTATFPNQHKKSVKRRAITLKTKREAVASSIAITTRLALLLIQSSTNRRCWSSMKTT